MGYIYKITNEVNNKVYIGQTKRAISIRWQEHLKDAFNLDKDNKLYRAMRKYGTDQFSCAILEEVPNDKLSDLEKLYISQYDSYYNGYNSTFGGEGTSYIDTGIIEQLYQEGKNCTEIAKITGHTRKSISTLLRGLGYDTTANKIPGHKGFGKIIKFNNQSFNSQRELAKYLLNNYDCFTNVSLHTIEKGISKALKNNTTYYGFQFN